VKSNEIRERFLRFFEERNHRIVASSSLIPDDLSLLLTAAGMVQFKPIFQGKKQVDFSRAASVQKCVRTTDIDEIGRTARHLTFFEMLGNFSFGDYYKKEAIAWAWELLTEDFKIDPAPLWITIFQDDDEAFEIWNREVGIGKERIVRLGEKDNFWSAGPTGPCGPSSEIIFDFGEEKSCGPDCGVGCDCDRFLEVWNLVFMQYDRDEQGRLSPLPRKNIDTGMGLERAAAILQGVESVFESDMLRPVVDAASKTAKISFGTSAEKDVSLKIIADHSRAITFLVSDGVLPSNEGRGYILRRLVRRAVRHGRLLGIEDIFLPPLVDRVVEVMKEAYPELSEHHAFLGQIVRSEEERFSQTLRQGLEILDQEIDGLKRQGILQIPGEVAFRLYDTYGFPLELTAEIAREENLTVDDREFEKYMEKQREKARAAVTAAGFAPAGIYHEIFSRIGKTEFVGYELDSVEAVVNALLQKEKEIDLARQGDEIEVILSKTPFYGEAGGQVGDRGEIETVTGRARVIDTQIPIPDLYVHRARVETGTIKVGQLARSLIDVERRKLIARNHTATHILHWALRHVLGEHAKQAGSLVDDKRLRFDFTHYAAVTLEELQRIEKLANEKILENHPVRNYVTSLEFARDSGAIALFGEKYGDFVRILEIGDFSRELCGGTHVFITGEIGLVKVISEAGVGANLRRIEALSGVQALTYLLDKEQALEEASKLLKVKPIEVPKRIVNILKESKVREKELETLKARLAQQEIGALLQAARQVDGIKVLISKVRAKDMASLRSYVDLLRDHIESGIVVLGASSDAKAMLVAAVSPDLVAKGYHAGHLLEKIAPLVGGGGGGRPDMAQAGGKNPAGVESALKEAEEQIRKMGKREA
jgi:alanyl-tRNA synthetase